MLQSVEVSAHPPEEMAGVAGRATIEELRELAAALRGARIVHVNATPYGGGVSELLRSTIPLMKGLGLDAEWQIIQGDDPFFGVTKAMHNALQGAETTISDRARELYLTYNSRNALLLDRHWDVVFIHDPQPVAIRQLHGPDQAKWIWRCHIDTAHPNEPVWEFLKPFVNEYDAAVFTMPEFVPPDLQGPEVAIIAPAIDPMSPKNMTLPPEMAWRILHWIGIDVDRPMITQVSRFDTWKDPLGVIEAYRLVRGHVPNLQLALVGSMALDDPEGWAIYNQIQTATKEEPDIRLFTNLNGVGSVEVNAFQRFSSVVIQKSLREGFGLVVAESMWKGTPVVAGRVGGIPYQMPEGVGGFLVDSVEATADRVLYLLNHPREAAELGASGQRRVADDFLITRLVRDELRLAVSLLKGSTSRRPRKPAPQAPVA